MSLEAQASCVSPDCSTHATIGDVRLPRRVLESDTIIVSCGLENFERNSWSKQHTHKFEGSHDELATVADYDKFAKSFENNYRRSFTTDDRLQEARRYGSRPEAGDTRWSKLQDHEI